MYIFLAVESATSMSLGYCRRRIQSARAEPLSGERGFPEEESERILIGDLSEMPSLLLITLTSNPPIKGALKI